LSAEFSDDADDFKDSDGGITEEADLGDEISAPEEALLL
jgi:hypothetical protein